MAILNIKNDPVDLRWLKIQRQIARNNPHLGVLITASDFLSMSKEIISHRKKAKEIDKLLLLLKESLERSKK